MWEIAAIHGRQYFKLCKFLETQNVFYGAVKNISPYSLILTASNYVYGKLHKSSIKNKIRANNPFSIILKNIHLRVNIRKAKRIADYKMSHNFSPLIRNLNLIFS